MGNVQAESELSSRMGIVWDDRGVHVRSSDQRLGLLVGICVCVDRFRSSTASPICCVVSILLPRAFFGNFPGLNDDYDYSVSRL